MAANRSGSQIRAAKERAVKGGKPKRCKKGKACGVSCINQTKLCLVSMADSVSQDLGKTSEMVKNRTSGEA